MTEPPFMLDGARVVAYAVLDVAAPGRPLGVVVDGVSTDTATVSRLAIAENLVEGGVWLLHCNDRWETVSGAHYADRESAEKVAAIAYDRVPHRWMDYRPLTAEEAREVETTRAFLREIAAEGDDG